MSASVRNRRARTVRAAAFAVKALASAREFLARPPYDGPLARCSTSGCPSDRVQEILDAVERVVTKSRQAQRFARTAGACERTSAEATRAARTMPRRDPYLSKLLVPLGRVDGGSGLWCVLEHDPHGCTPVTVRV
jgi:hypothetical protein